MAAESARAARGITKKTRMKFNCVSPRLAVIKSTCSKSRRRSSMNIAKRVPCVGQLRDLPHESGQWSWSALKKERRYTTISSIGITRSFPQQEQENFGQQFHYKHPSYVGDCELSTTVRLEQLRTAACYHQHENNWMLSTSVPPCKRADVVAHRLLNPRVLLWSMVAQIAQRQIHCPQSYQ